MILIMFFGCFFLCCLFIRCVVVNHAVQYMYACMYVYTYVCIYVCFCVRIYVYIYVYIYIRQILVNHSIRYHLTVNSVGSGSLTQHKSLVSSLLSSIEVYYLTVNSVGSGSLKLNLPLLCGAECLPPRCTERQIHIARVSIRQHTSAYVSI
jgi:hypothetical protein